jgi:predicted nucleic acid-binding protein
MYTLDTNAIIYYVKNDVTAVPRIRELLLLHHLYISTVTELELFSLPDLPANESSAIESMLKWLTIVPLDSRIARTAAAMRQGCRLEFADSAIAATALVLNTTLVTRNVRDFKRVPGLSIEKI